jgi:hypothetical protein
MATYPVVPHQLTANGTAVPMVATPVSACKPNISISSTKLIMENKLVRIQYLKYNLHVHVSSSHCTVFNFDQYYTLLVNFT